ncbi:MAG: HNH endonuclease signature motif containing protein [Bacteroidota bacterium]
MSQRKKVNISSEIRAAVRQRANASCEYCKELELFDSFTYQIDHIIAEQHGGNSELDNLAFACRTCNLYKGPNLASILPGSTTLVELFHPRKQVWSNHFSLDNSGEILVLTNTGHVTARLLRFNDVDRIVARKKLIAKGFLQLG